MLPDPTRHYIQPTKSSFTSETTAGRLERSPEPRPPGIAKEKKARPRIQEYRRGDESKLMLMLFSRRLLALAAGSYTPPYFRLLCVQKTYKYRPLSSFRLPSASSTSSILYHSIFTQSCFPRILPSSLFSSCPSSRRSVRPQQV